MSFNKKQLKVQSTAKKLAKPKDYIEDPAGQYKYPGQVTKIPSGDITMAGVNYPVLGIDDLGNQILMQPNQDYTFPGDSVMEFPQFQQGGQREPLYVSSKNDPRYKAYLDSLQLFKINTYDNKWLVNAPKVDWSKKVINNQSWSDHSSGYPARAAHEKAYDRLTALNKKEPSTKKNQIPFKVGFNDYGMKDLSVDTYFTRYKKPVQPVVYQKPLQQISSVQPVEAQLPIIPRKELDLQELQRQYPETLASRTLPVATPKKKNLSGFSAQGAKFLGIDDTYQPDLLEAMRNSFKKGGQNRTPRNFTNQNIQSSINDLMIRNSLLFGPSGKNRYSPLKNDNMKNTKKLKKYPEGGELGYPQGMPYKQQQLLYDTTNRWNTLIDTNKADHSILNKRANEWYASNQHKEYSNLVDKYQFKVLDDSRESAISPNDKLMPSYGYHKPFKKPVDPSTIPVVQAQPITPTPQPLPTGDPNYQYKAKTFQGFTTPNPGMAGNIPEGYSVNDFNPNNEQPKVIPSPVFLHGGIAFPDAPTGQQFFSFGQFPQGPEFFYQDGGQHMMPDGSMMYDQDMVGEYMKSGGWIQKATKGMRTDKPCTGSKFGGPDCPPGSKRYNLAKTFKSFHKQDGGQVEILETRIVNGKKQYLISHD